MKRGTIFLVIFVLIAAGIVGASLFLQNQPPLQITIAVDPLAADWMRQAAADFNASDTRINSTRRVEVVIQSVSDLDVWAAANRSDTWTTELHPDGWIPSTSISAHYTSLPFVEVQPSMAKTVLVIGGFASRVEVLNPGGTIGWADIFKAAEAERWDALGGQSSWQFVNLAFTLADRKMCGLATLFSASAALNNTATLGSSQVRGDFYSQFESVVASVPNFNAVGNDIASYMALGGPTATDIGIGPESLWLKNLSGLLNNEDVRFSYPEYTFVFDFPLYRWNATNTSTDTTAAVQAFGNWLMAAPQQSAVQEFGLRPSSGEVVSGTRLFDNALVYGITLTMPTGEVIQPPSSLTDTQGLISWFQRTRS